MYKRRRMGVDDIPLSFNNSNSVNGTVLGRLNTTDDGSTPGIQIFMDPMPSHTFLWKIGIIFAVTGIIVITTFIAMFFVNHQRRNRVFRRHRRRQMQQTLAFENQLSVTEDELVDDARIHNNDHVPVHQSCTNSDRRWSRDGDTQPRSRSNSRSRSLSPGSGARSKSPTSPKRTPHSDLEDDRGTHSALENVRLAFKEDTPRYDSTIERAEMGV